MTPARYVLTGSIGTLGQGFGAISRASRGADPRHIEVCRRVGNEGAAARAPEDRSHDPERPCQGRVSGNASVVQIDPSRRVKDSATRCKKPSGAAGTASAPSVSALSTPG